MPEALSSTAVEKSNTVDSVDTNNMGIQSLAHLILVEKLNYSEEEARREVDHLRDRQKLQEFLTHYLREVNNNTKEGSSALDPAKFEDLKNEGLALYDDVRKKKANLHLAQAEHEAASAEFIALEKEIAYLEEHIKEIEQTLKACDIMNSNNEKVERGVYNENEKNRLVENIRSQQKNLNQSSNYQQQVIQKLNNLRHETLMIAKQIIETLHNTFKKIISFMGGR